MKLTFLGHQTWLISHGSTNIIIDPLLLNKFGHSSDINFEIFPSRNIQLDRMPKIDAIILSHEHLDHFHIPSLNMLPKDAPVYVSNLLPICVKDIIIELGFQLIEVYPLQNVTIKDLVITFFSSGNRTIFWEQRVIQIYIQKKDSQDKGVFIAVDALISEDFKEAVDNEWIVQPRAVVVSNNSQIVPPGGVGAHTNMLPLEERFGNSLQGLTVLHAMLITYFEGLGHDVQEIVICGNGFIASDGSTASSELYGPFLFSDNKKLAAMASELSIGKTILGPYPGEELIFDDEDNIKVNQVSWVQLNKTRIDGLLKKQREFLENPQEIKIRPIRSSFINKEEARNALIRVEEELCSIAKAMMISEIGKIAINLREHLNGSLGCRRILFRFLEENNETAIQYALDFSTASFVYDETPTDQLLETFPFGIEVFLVDFFAIIEGKLQIWDLAGNAMRSWYIGDSYTNIISFLYAFYGEQVRPELAKKVYQTVLNNEKAKIASEEKLYV